MGQRIASSELNSSSSHLSPACRDDGRDPATLGVTALIGLWFPDLQAKKPSFFDNPLTGTVEEIAAAIRGYAELGVQHIMFQVEPYTPEARQRLTEALQIYRFHEPAIRKPDNLLLQELETRSGNIPA